MKHDHTHIFTYDLCDDEDGLCEQKGSAYCLLCNEWADDIATDLQKELNKVNDMSIDTLYLPVLAKTKVEQVLVENVEKYPDEKWKTQTVEEHLTHLVEHVADYQLGSKEEDWLAKIVCRAAMAAWKDEHPKEASKICTCMPISTCPVHGPAYKELYARHT